MEKQVKKLIRKTLKRAADPRVDSVRQMYTSRLEDGLKKRNVARILTGADALGTWYFGDGLGRLLGGDASGWVCMRTGHTLVQAALRAQDAMSRKDGRARVISLVAAHTVGFGLALGDPRVDEWLELYCDRFSSGRFVPSVSSYPAAMAVVAEFALNGWLNLPGGVDLGIYAGMFAAWHHQGFASAVSAALDFHVENADARGEGDLPEFEDLGIHLYPAEILGVFRARERHGLATSQVAHPLLETELFASAPSPQWDVTDELAIRTCAAVDRL